RRIFFSPSLIRIVEKRELAINQPLNFDHKLIGQKGLKPPVLLEMVSSEPWKGWTRTVSFRNPAGLITAQQHVGFLTQYWARIDMAGNRDYFWSGCYLTSEIPPEELLALLATHPAYEERLGLAQGAIIERRDKVIKFLTQCGHYELAEQELKRLAKDFPA